MQSVVPLIVNTSRWNGRPPGKFFSPQFSNQLRWQFIDAEPAGFATCLRWIRRPNLSRVWGGFKTGLSATVKNASLVVSHDPRVTFNCELFLRTCAFRGPHLAFSFNLPSIPSGVQLKLMRSAFTRIDRCVVYSSVERTLYHEAFGIPLEKIDFIHWGVNPPEVSSPERALITGDYICALGENGRDYRSLVEAMKSLPEIRLVIVARPYNLKDLEIPGNVEVRTNIPIGEANNILAHSRFMVVPLAGSEVPCGHVTLVNSMYLSKAFVISNSSGVADYVKNRVNAVTCEPFSPDALAFAIRNLWNDRNECDRIGQEGRRFAEQYCSEASTLSWFTQYLKSKGLLINA